MTTFSIALRSSILARQCVFLACSLALAACLSEPLADNILVRDTAALDATPADAMHLVLDNADFAIMGRYFKPRDTELTTRLWVVIEGDGARWRGGQPPADPTPRHPMGPSLLDALPQDEARLYLARPCQYLTPTMLSRCPSRYWTTRRFTGEIIAAYDALISQHTQGASQLILVGFSGGGVLAAEIALHRPDLAGLITIAAPLDLALWSDIHDVPTPTSPTPPTELLSRIGVLKVQKLFLFGGNDTIVPIVALSQVRQLLPPETVQILPGFNHASPWATPLSQWARTYNQY